MAKFDLGDWVRHRKKRHRGVVCGHRNRSVLVRWAGTQKAEPWGSRSLIACDPPRALVMEGTLDDDLESTRSEEGLLRNWLGANHIPVAYKSILTLADIQVIGRSIGAHRPAFVHISCHGAYDDDWRAYLRFAPGKRKSDQIYLDDDQTLKVFREAFQGLPLLFSACLLGKYQDAITAFAKTARLAAVAAFSREVEDSEAMLFALLLYQGVLLNSWTFRNAVDKACSALLALGLRGAPGGGQRFVRVFPEK